MVADLIASGENGRSNGYGYEDVIVELINNYKTEKEGKKIVSYIAKDLGINNLNDYSVYSEKTPKNVKNRFGGQMKPPKADVHIIFEKNGEKIEKGISIKSSNGSVQVQITNVKNFREIIEKNGIDFPDELYNGLSKFCGFGDFKPSKLLISNINSLNSSQKLCLKKLEEETKISKADIECVDCLNDLFKLSQGRRNRWLINELTDKERKIIKDFFNKNQTKITEILLKEGFSEKEYYADYYLVNKNEYSSTKKVDICIKNMNEVIKESCKNGYKETKDGSFHIGNITVQMKGSGKKEAFHGLQFNKRL